MNKPDSEDDFFNKNIAAYSRNTGKTKAAMEQGKEWETFIPKANKGPMSQKLEFPQLSGTKKKS
jgi:hypothetical protein